MEVSKDQSQSDTPTEESLSRDGVTVDVIFSKIIAEIIPWT